MNAGVGSLLPRTGLPLPGTNLSREPRGLGARRLSPPLLTHRVVRGRHRPGGWGDGGTVSSLVRSHWVATLSFWAPGGKQVTRLSCLPGRAVRRAHRGASVWRLLQLLTGVFALRRGCGWTGSPRDPSDQRDSRHLPLELSRSQWCVCLLSSFL